MRVITDGNPFDLGAGDGCRWLAAAAAVPPCAMAYRCRFDADGGAAMRVHVSADERYELFLDGRRIGRGPERGDALHWYFETYDLPLAAGSHTLVARVWSLGHLAPMAQHSAGHGLIVSAERPFHTAVSTGLGPWEARRLEGYRIVDPILYLDEGWARYTGSDLTVDAAHTPWDCEDGGGSGWSARDLLHADAAMNECGELPAHLLVPGSLPAMLDQLRRVGVVRHVCAGVRGDRAVTVRPAEHLEHEAEEWQALVDGCAHVQVPPQSVRHAVIDLQSYYCLYPRLVASGGRGAQVSLAWAEAPYLGAQSRIKGRRDQLESACFLSEHPDTLLLDGGAGRVLESAWWRAGRYLILTAETAQEPLTIDGLDLRETRYPLEMESTFACEDERVGRVIPIALRALQMCAHETYMDCPYYEQLMYAGDTRLQALVTYTLGRDDRLPRKALSLFAASRLPGGLTQSRYPSRRPQVIPPFALWWVDMVHDYALWRGDRDLVASLLPAIRGVLDAFLDAAAAGGGAGVLPGWNFVDWVPAWANGVPPGSAEGANGCVGWQLVLTLDLAAELEQWAGQLELAQRFRRHAGALVQRLQPLFWDDARGMFADDPARQSFSEHAQALALLSGRLDPAQQQRVAAGLLGDSTLSRCTIYFSHYLFEAYRLLGRVDALYQRLGFWFDLAPHGFVTTPETSDLASTRSDCHAWGAHPLYHLYASILGVRPASFGFQTVEVAPQLGPLRWARGRLVHPAGAIEVDLLRTEMALAGSITLPRAVSGVLRLEGTTQPLHPGRQEVNVAIVPTR